MPLADILLAMEAPAQAFLQQLLETPSPSGYERRVQEVVRAYLAGVADEITLDNHGNLIACINPRGRPRVMWAGHCDQIGMLVSHVDDNGFVYAQPVGGWDPQQLIGQRMTIWSESGPLPAVISRKPIHLLTEEERRQVAKIDDMWLDIGAANRDEARSLVRNGDPVTLELGFQAMRNNLVNAPGMDDKTGVWVVMEAFRRASERKLECALFAVSTVQEEIGLRGARTSTYRVEPDVGIAVDVTHATDCPSIDSRQRGEVRLGKGPVIFRGPNTSPNITRRLLDLCAANNIPHQLVAIGRAAPNDANPIQVSRAGVATGLVAIPNRYMHSAVETVSLDDLDQAAELLAVFAVSLTPDDDFTPDW